MVHRSYNAIRQGSSIFWGLWHHVAPILKSTARQPVSSHSSWTNWSSTLKRTSSTAHRPRLCRLRADANLEGPQGTALQLAELQGFTRTHQVGALHIKSYQDTWCILVLVGCLGDSARDMLWRHVPCDACLDQRVLVIVVRGLFSFF